MQFSKFTENWGRKAVLLMLAAHSQEQVYHWALANGFDLSKSFSGNDQNPEEFDFHVTIICSENEQMVMNGLKSIPPITTTFDQFEVLGKRTEESAGVPVLTVVKNGLMMETRKFYEDFYGLYDNWPDWKAHMSLSYFWNGVPDVALLPVPNFPITFNQIKVSNLD